MKISTTLALTVLFAVSQSPAGQSQTTPAPPDLAGTSWQLVRYLASDNSSRKPDKRADYTLDFNTDGSLAVRVDCDRGRGTWKVYAPNQIMFGPLALTRACTANYIHGRMVKDLTFVRSYVVDNGRLFLWLMADLGTYEFEQLTRGVR